MSRKPVKGEWNYKRNKTNKKVINKKYDLPEPIIHKILSVLEPKDAAKTRFLSITWQRAMASFPCIHLDESDFTVQIIIEKNSIGIVQRR